MFRGREMAFTDASRAKLEEIARLLGDVAVLDVPPKVEGRTMSMMMNPKRAPTKSSERADDDDE